MFVWLYPPPTTTPVLVFSISKLSVTKMTQPNTTSAFNQAVSVQRSKQAI